MERYLEVTTLDEAETAERSCDLLERAGIPVIIRHVDLTNSYGTVPGYMLLVPTQHSNQAHTLIGMPIQ